jgi:hypothetical protein
MGNAECGKIKDVHHRFDAFYVHSLYAKRVHSSRGRIVRRLEAAARGNKIGVGRRLIGGRRLESCLAN